MTTDEAYKIIKGLASLLVVIFIPLLFDYITKNDKDELSWWRGAKGSFALLVGVGIIVKILQALYLVICDKL